MKKDSFDWYFFLALVILVTIVSFLIVRPYLKSVLGAIVIVYLFYPLYEWLLKKLKRRVLTSVIMLIIVLLTVSVPLAFILTSIYQEATSTLKYVRQNFPQSGEFNIFCDEGDDSAFCNLVARIDDAVPTIDIKQKISDGLTDAANNIQDWALSALAQLSSGLLQTFIMLFIVFFLFMDGEALAQFVRKILKLSKHHESNIIQTLENTTYAVVYGTLIVALIQGVFAGLGYWLIGGISNPILWGAVTALFALVPTIGTAFIWLPISLFLILIGLVSQDYGTLTRGIILGAYGFFVISTIDNILKPKIIGKRADIHPVIVLLGVLGGLQFGPFGVLGLILGPVVLAILITLLRLYIKERE